MNTLSRGALIVIEGVDRSGKSTQCRRLFEALKKLNRKVELLNFPDRSTPIGATINEYLVNKDCVMNDHAIHLLFTANRWEKFEIMCEKLKSGVTLIVDRYSYSGIVYSSIKKGMDLNWCKNSERGLLEPDQVFLLTVPSSNLHERTDFGNERYETVTFQEKVAQAFLDLSQNEKNWEIIETHEKSIEQVHDTILCHTLKVIVHLDDQPLRYLDFNA